MLDTEKNKLSLGDKVRIRFSRKSLIKYLKDIGNMTFDEFIFAHDYIIGCDGYEGVVLEMYDDCVYCRC